MQKKLMSLGRLIKTKFFQATRRRGEENLLRPVAYVCDEFHRFITGDPDSGEQSFLDCCRAYRGICVLATQSVASIRKAVSDSGDRLLEMNVFDCISIILSNTGTKLFFRNTDRDTQERLKALIPCHPKTNADG
jgi:type IV secretory pathway TraG/TraD family ATPase VirD4